VYPYLSRGLIIDRPNQVWCADITYIPMARGFVYLVAVMDWFSRRVLSWRLSITMEADFCVEAVQEAMAKHGRPQRYSSPAPRFWMSLKQRASDQHGWQGRFLDNLFIERALAKPEIRRGFHQGVWLGDRGAPRHRRMARFLQRGAAASGVGLSDAACGFRRRSL
jgi:transposase InsO family protein